MKQSIEQSLGCREMNYNNVQYYSRHTKELGHSQVRKATLFLQHECIKYINEDMDTGERQVFICLPLNQDSQWIVNGKQYNKLPFTENYNSTAYHIYKSNKYNNTFECDCQGWQSKHKRGAIVEEGANCCHVLSLYYAFKIKQFNNHNPKQDKGRGELLTTSFLDNRKPSPFLPIER